LQSRRKFFAVGFQEAKWMWTRLLVLMEIGNAGMCCVKWNAFGGAHETSVLKPVLL
jgi:hypothetical protein